MNSYIAQIKNRMKGAPKDNYFSQLRNFKPGQPPVEKKDHAAEDPDAEIKKDILEAKQAGYTIQDVMDAIDDIADIKEKDRAKEVAKNIFSRE